MSYQVLYILSRTEEPPAGAGACVCTAETPEPLLKELRESTRLRRSAWGLPSFLYRTLEAGEKIYHAMTCMNGMGEGVLVHHLVFTEAETAVLRREEMRPTPAGIMAALCQEKFWPLPALPDTPPRLSIDAEALPSPVAQPTWKRLTGHKTTAKRLIESPYDARCALILPRTAESADVLRLLHESDWLTSTCGWGVSFCTAADEADACTALRRMACAEGSAAERAAHRAGIPCFTVRQEKHRLTPTHTYRPEYVYTEEEETRFYPLARKLSRKARQRFMWALGAAAPVVLGLAFLGRSYLPPLPLLHPAAPAEPAPPSPAAKATEAPPQPEPAPAPQEPPAEPAEPADVQPAVILPGGELPAAVAEQTAEGEWQLTRGELRIALIGAGECFLRTLTEEQPATLLREPAGYSLRYTAEGDALNLCITLADGKVAAVTLNGTPAAADFTLPHNGQRLILIPCLAEADGGTAELKALPPAWPPKRYIPCDKLLAPTPPTAAYPYGRLQIGRGVPAVPQEGGTAKISFPLALPDLGYPNLVPEPLNELPTAYRYRWKQRGSTARLTVERNLAPAVQQGFEHRMNTYCGGTAGEGDSYYSLATLYGLATLLETADLPPAARAKAEADYARLFTDAAFCRLVKEEILSPADHALCLTPEEAADASPRGQQRRQELAALLTPANCFKIREAVAQQVQPTLAAAYAAAVQALPPAPHPVLQLQNVTLQQGGSLQWQFRLYPAP